MADFILMLGTGTYDLAGAPAASTYQIDLSPGSYALTGEALELDPSALVMMAGSVAITGQSLLLSRLPDPPTGLTAFAGDGLVTLNWNAAPLATGYNVYAGVSPGSLTLVTSITALSTILGGMNTVPLYMKVTATSTLGEGVASAVISSTPTGGIQPLWGFDDEEMTFDNPNYTFDGLIFDPGGGGGGGGGGDITILSIEMELSEVVRGTVALFWSAQPPGSPANYDVQVNNVVVQQTALNAITISGLLVDTDYSIEVVGSRPGGVPVQSNIIHYRYGSTEIGYVDVPLTPVLAVE